MMSKFNCNDVVMVREGAWSRILNGSDTNLTPLERVEAKNYQNERREFRILATNSKIEILPDKFANTLIRALDNDEIIAINDCNLYQEHKITVAFMSNGKDVTAEMSEESKRAVLEANL